MSLPPLYPEITFIFVPNSLLSIAGNVSMWEPAPEPPTVNSFSRVSRQVLIGEVCQATQIEAAAAMLPIQFIWRGSNFASEMPYSGANGTLEWTMPMVVPSRGAREFR